MKVILKDLRDAAPALAKILSFEIDAKLAYRITKITKKINSELEAIDETRKKLIEKYGEKQKTGYFKVKEEHQKTFNDEFESLLKVETEIDIQNIPFECIQGFKVSAVDMALVENFIEEPKEGAPQKPPEDKK